VPEKSTLNSKNIMVVDDHPANLKLLEEMLRGEGYQVRSFPRGRLGLAAAAQNPPDLILLDINMPEMSGYEMCEKLKSDERLAQIPVIFLSALDATADKVKAFQCGGVDYISKPFQFEEVQARVETHLQLRLLRQTLQSQNECLEETVRMRTRELTEALTKLTILDRAKGDFLSLISHELRTPLNGILGVGELVLDEIPDTVEGRELREMFDVSRRRILALLDDALLLKQVELEGNNFELAHANLSTVLKRALDQVTECARSRRVILESLPSDFGFVIGEENLLIRALQALLGTAVKFSNQDEAVRLRCEAATDSVNLIVESVGQTIPESIVSKFFDLFSISEAATSGGDLGMGPSVAYRILSLFGGGVTVENLNPAGLRFTASLQCAHLKATDVGLEMCG
jgi:two-component system sensor histidine kinase/response regulator